MVSTWKSVGITATLAFLSFTLFGIAEASTQVIVLADSPGSLQSWMVPSDWNDASNTVETIGAGGSGGAGTAGAGASGGGGGAWNEASDVSLTPDTTVDYEIGAGGDAVSASYDSTADGVAGGKTWFCSSTSNCGALASSSVAVGSQGGQGGLGDFGVGVSGGSGASGVGSVYADGGNSAGASEYVNNYATGGGGAAGPNGNGTSSVTATGSDTTSSGGSGDNAIGGVAGANSAGSSGLSGTYPYGSGGAGGAGAEWTATTGGTFGAGAGGGGGFTYNGDHTGGNGSYGGGGGAIIETNNDSVGPAVSGAGGQGLIVITYTPAVAPPASPDDFELSTSSPSSLAFTWSTGDASTTSYDITIASGTTAPSCDGGGYIATSSTSLVETGLTASTTYAVALCASDSDGNLSNPTTLTATTLSSPPDSTPPSTPTDLIVTAVSTSTVSLGWTASTDNVGVAGYQVFRDSVQVATSTATSFTDTGLATSTSYTYSLTAFDAAGNISSTSSSVATTSMASAPISQVKPDGVPTVLSNALTSDLMMYVVDTGKGNYAIADDSTAQAPHFIDPAGTWNPRVLNLNVPGRTGYTDVDPATLASRVDNNGFGNAVQWPGTLVDNMGTLISLQDVDDLRDAVSLSGPAYSGGPTPADGSGYTLGATFDNTGDDDELGSGGAYEAGEIWGRPIDLDPGGPYGVGNIYMGAGSDHHLYFTWETVQSPPGAETGQTIKSTDPVSENQLHTVVVSMVKNSSGLVDVTMWIDGIEEASTTNSTSYDNGGELGGDQENQFQIGTMNHVVGSQPNATFDGNIFQAWVSDRAWSQSEAAAVSADPFGSMTEYTDANLPPAPASFTTTASSSNSLTLGWSSGGGSTTSYDINLVSGSYPASCNSSGYATTTSTSFTETGLATSTAYSMAICAVDASGELSSWTTLTATTSASGGGGGSNPPPAPTSFVLATSTQTSLTLGWDSGGGSTEDYDVNIASGTTAPSCDGSGYATTTATAFTETGLTASSTYTMALCAVDSAGELSDQTSLIATTSSLSGGGGDGGPTQIIVLADSPGSLQSWMVPSDWNDASNTIETIGAGGSGGAGTAGAGASGGGGGAWNEASDVSLTPDTTVDYEIGAGGDAVSASYDSTADGVAGGKTWFCSSTSNCGALASSSVAVGSQGGQGGLGDFGVGVSGGSGASGVGSVYADGGNSAGASEYVNNYATGGGGAAGPNGNGTSSVTATGSDTTSSGGSGDNTAGGVAGTNSAGSSGLSGTYPYGSGGAGGAGAEWTATAGGTYGAGAGGGGGFTYNGDHTGGNGSYGGGGGAIIETNNDSVGPAVSGAGGQGLIVITYTPAP